MSCSMSMLIIYYTSLRFYLLVEWDYLFMKIVQLWHIMKHLMFAVGAKCTTEVRQKD